MTILAYSYGPVSSAPTLLSNFYYTLLNGKYFITPSATFGDRTSFFVSEDGQNWSSGAFPVSKTWSPPVYANGVYLLSASDLTVTLTSADGVSWTQNSFTTSGSGGSRIGVIDGKFVVLRFNSNQFYYSTDGAAWTAGTLPSSAQWSSGSLTVLNDKLFALASSNSTTSNKVIFTSNGTTWTAGTLPLTTYWRGPAYGDGAYVAYNMTGAARNYVASSTDGVVWASRTLPYSDDWEQVVWTGSFFYVCSSTHYAKSTDGVTWVGGELPEIFPDTISGGFIMSFVNGKILLRGYDDFSYNSNLSTIILSSEDGETWSVASVPPADYGRFQNFRYPIWTGSHFVYVCMYVSFLEGVLPRPAAIYSADGEIWFATLLSEDIASAEIAYSVEFPLVMPSGHAGTLLLVDEDLDTLLYWAELAPNGARTNFWTSLRGTYQA
jgi:hypothetical protein